MCALPFSATVQVHCNLDQRFAWYLAHITNINRYNFNFAI